MLSRLVIYALRASMNIATNKIRVYPTLTFKIGHLVLLFFFLNSRCRAQHISELGAKSNPRHRRIANAVIRLGTDRNRYRNMHLSKIQIYIYVFVDD